MPVLFLAIALAVVIAIAFVAIGRLGELPEADVDIAEPYLPEGPVTPDGLAGTRFAVGLRGYRMSQVDDVLDRVIRDLADRDLRIAELESELTTQRTEQPGGAGPEGESVKLAAEPSGPVAVGGTKGAEEPVGALPPDVRAHDGSTPSSLTSSPPWALPTGSTEDVTTERNEQPGGAGREGESVKLAAEHSGPAPAGGTEGDNEHSGPAPASGTEGDNEPAADRSTSN